MHCIKSSLFWKYVILFAVSLSGSIAVEGYYFQQPIEKNFSK